MLDGCPTTLCQAKWLKKFGVIPVQAMNIRIPVEESVKRALFDQMHRPPLDEPIHDRWVAVTAAVKWLAQK